MANKRAFEKKPEAVKVWDSKSPKVKRQMTKRMSYMSSGPVSEIDPD